jgi:hypothetical protein
MEWISLLATLALSPHPGVPPRLPVNPATVLEQPVALLEQAWGPVAPSQAQEGWYTLVWPQRWWGLAPHPTAYRITPTGTLQSISLSWPDCIPIIAALTQDLGEPTENATSPHFLNSLRYWRWEREGVAFAVEDFAPGCEVSIYRYTP